MHTPAASAALHDLGGATRTHTARTHACIGCSVTCTGLVVIAKSLYTRTHTHMHVSLPKRDTHAQSTQRLVTQAFATTP